VGIGREEGLPHDSAIRCDVVMLMFKRKLTGFVGTLPPAKQRELKRALSYALQLDP
jgi:mRNA-degrading endonuclease toxin of MazEF toxin-antitoxin module